MKAKKARKVLREVDELLANVIGKYRADTTGVHELLDSAREAVAGAMTSLDQAAAKISPKPAATPGKRRLARGGRKPVSAATKKKPGAVTNNKRVRAATGGALHQTGHSASTSAA